MTARKPCFDCDPSEQDKMEFGECVQSPLFTGREATCCHTEHGIAWENCACGAKSGYYPAFIAKQNMTQCPCCKGSGFVGKEGSIVDEIRALECEEFVAAREQARNSSLAAKQVYISALEFHLAAILRRLK